MNALFSERGGKHFVQMMMGFSLLFDNGWMIDASFGPGCYADNHNMHVKSGEFPSEFESNTCATIVQNSQRDWTYEIAQKFGLSCYKECPELVYLPFNKWWEIAQYIEKLPKECDELPPL